MCMKVGSDEFETVKSLMSMTLFAIISDCLDVDIVKIKETDLLFRDLGMSVLKGEEIQQIISDIYDGAKVELSEITTIQSVVDQVLIDQLSAVNRVLH